MNIFCWVLLALDIMGLILTRILSACTLHVLPVPWMVSLNGPELGIGMDVCLAFSPFSITAYIGCRSLSQLSLGGRSGTQVPWFISSTQSCQWVALSTRRGARPTSQVRTSSCACWVWPGIGSSTPVTWVQLKQWGMTGCTQLIWDCSKNKQSQTNHWIVWSQCLSVLIYFSVCDGGDIISFQLCLQFNFSKPSMQTYFLNKHWQQRQLQPL